MVTLTQASEAIPAAVNFRQAAEILQMSPNTLRKLFERGDVRTTRIIGTRQRLISKDEILRLLAEGHDQPDQDYPPCSGTTTTGAPCHRRRAVIDNNTSALYCSLHMQEETQGQIIERSVTT